MGHAQTRISTVWNQAAPIFISMTALFGAARVMDTMTAAMTTFQTSKTLSH